MIVIFAERNSEYLSLGQRSGQGDERVKWREKPLIIGLFLNSHKFLEFLAKSMSEKTVQEAGEMMESPIPPHPQAIRCPLQTIR